MRAKTKANGHEASTLHTRVQQINTHKSKEQIHTLCLTYHDRPGGDVGHGILIRKLERRLRAKKNNNTRKKKQWVTKNSVLLAVNLLLQTEYEKAPEQEGIHGLKVGVGWERGNNA